MTTKQIDDIKRLLADLESAEKHKQVLRHELTRLRDVVSAVEYESIDAALAMTEVQPCDSKLNAAARNALPSLLDDIEMLRGALQAISLKHPGYGGSGDIARKALAATEVQP
jgi:predicted  nucleic acid-binding Zn-ribbon protein